MTKISVAVAGAKGYVGSAICQSLKNKQGILLTEVTRENYETMRSGSYDILVHSAMPSGRFWAKNHPEEDYQETVRKTACFLNDWKYGKFIQISTVSARCELHTVYGRHKAEAEKLCHSSRNLIVRLSAMYSPGLSKGAVIDILKGSRVYVSGESRYAFTPLHFASSWISDHLERSGTVEVGAKNTVSLKEIADYLGTQTEFEGPVEIQEIQNPEAGFPDARDIFKYLDSLKK